MTLRSRLSFSAPKDSFSLAVNSRYKVNRSVLSSHSQFHVTRNLYTRYLLAITRSILHLNMTLPVLISGAGLGGVCLGQALKKNNIPFKIFERCAKDNFSTQGYRLRISTHGVSALNYALTPEIFSLFEKTCAEAPKLGVRVRPDGSPTAPMGLPAGVSPGGKAYTIDRSVFRDALLTGLEGNVFFEKKLEQYTIHGDRVTVSFSNGTTEEGSLLIGADGVRSNIRKQYVPDFQGIDTGMRIIFGKTPLTSDFLAELPNEYRDGMSLVTNDDDNSQPVLMFESIRFPHAKEISTIDIPDPYMYWVLVVHRSRIPSSDQKFVASIPKRSSGTCKRINKPVEFSNSHHLGNVR